MDDAELKQLVFEIHQAIVGGLNGNPGLLERVRNLEKFKNKIKSLMTFCVTMVATNIGTIVTIIVASCMKIN